jgi:hypothetical protein
MPILGQTYEGLGIWRADVLLGEDHWTPVGLNRARYAVRYGILAELLVRTLRTRIVESITVGAS